MRSLFWMGLLLCLLEQYIDCMHAIVPDRASRWPSCGAHTTAGTGRGRFNFGGDVDGGRALGSRRPYDEMVEIVHDIAEMDLRDPVPSCSHENRPRCVPCVAAHPGRGRPQPAKATAVPSTSSGTMIGIAESSVATGAIGLGVDGSL